VSRVKEVLNRGRLAEAEETGLQALYEHPWAEIELLTKILEYDNGALHGQHVVAVLVVVYWVRAALLSERQRADLMHTYCTHNHMHTNYIDCTQMHTVCILIRLNEHKIKLFVWTGSIKTFSTKTN
jgi:hypothetical protein